MVSSRRQTQEDGAESVERKARASRKEEDHTELQNEAEVEEEEEEELDDVDGVPEGDEEFKDEPSDDDDDYEEDAKRRRSSPSKTPQLQQQHSRRGRPPKRKVGDNSATEDAVSGHSDSDRSRSVSIAPDGTVKRPRLSYPVDDKGVALPVMNDEYVLPDDPEGDKKITKNGDLLGGRKFLVRTFTLTGKGEQKFMLSTEPARAVGFRDSYLFFQYHPNLYKFIITQDQKNDLIDRGVLPYSYRSRQIALVSALSVFKEFGAKMIINGKHITDDYYVNRLRESGLVVEGAYAREPANGSNMKNQALASYGDPYAGINPAKNAVEFFDKRHHGHNNEGVGISSTNKLTATNWLYQHAAACSRFNSDMYYDRVRVLLIENQGLRDAYTNTLHVPLSTQSSKVLGWYKKEGKDTSSVVYETRIEDPDLTKTVTGLADVPAEMFDGLVDGETKAAILEQQHYERNL